MVIWPCCQESSFGVKPWKTAGRFINCCEMELERRARAAAFLQTREEPVTLPEAALRLKIRNPTLPAQILRRSG